MKKNGEIELLRFVFAMIIVIFHFEFNYGFGIFTQGRIGVEFFFLVTGVLMAKTTEKVHIESHSIPNQTYAFILKKIKSFYPCFIVVFVLRCILELLVLDKIPIAVVCRKVLLSIPGLLLFKMNGISYEECIDVGGDWFLSAMVLAIFILYPILLYNYEWATKIIFPIIGLVGIGFMFMCQHTIIATTQIVGGMFRGGLLRAINEISLGVWGYALAKKMGGYEFTIFSKIFLTVFKWMSFGMVICYAFFGFQDSFSAIAFVGCFIGIILSFSEKTYVIPYNKMTCVLGKLSLPIYLSHNLVKGIAIRLWGTDIENKNVFIIICLCPIIAFIVMRLTDVVIRYKKKLRPIFIAEK